MGTTGTRSSEVLVALVTAAALNALPPGNAAHAQQQLIVNGGFESGLANWSTIGAFHADAGFAYPRTGTRYLYLSQPDGTHGNNLNGECWQQFTIPANAAYAGLTYYWNVSSQEGPGGAYDFLNATLQDSAGDFLSHLRVYSNLDQSVAGNYQLSSFNLTGFRGQTIRLHFLGTTDESLPSVFRIDDVSVDVVMPGTIETYESMISHCTVRGQDAVDYSFTVSNSGGYAGIQYAIAVNQPWLTVTPPGGSTVNVPLLHTINFSTSGLAAGDYFATMTISDPGATNPVVAIPLSLSVREPPLSAATEAITRVSVSSTGTEANSDSIGSVISADGRFIAFYSWASNVVPGDTNGAWDVFVRDRYSGQTSRVSVSSFGTQSNEGDLETRSVSISADGRYVAFRSGASNLVTGDTNDAKDIFVHDRLTGQTSRVSVASDGTQADSAGWLAISGNGRFVAFYSWSPLVPEDSNDRADVFVHDRQTGQTTRVSVSSSGAQVNDYEADGTPRLSISGDGRFVVFESNSAMLVPNDTNDSWDIFVHDRQTGGTARVSVDSFGAQANGSSHSPSISADGRYVAFYSRVSNLVPDDTNESQDVFVHDRLTAQTTRVSVDSSGTQADGDESESSHWGSSMSADGRFVAFRTTASNLATCDTNYSGDVFVHDRSNGQTTCVSLTPAGATANASSSLPSISADGQFVAFSSGASDLIPGDTNESYDVFVVDRMPCGSGLIADCNGNCAPAVWVGDGICDDGTYKYIGVPIYFNCQQFGNDGGDCSAPMPPIMVPPNHDQSAAQPAVPVPESPLPTERNLLFITHGCCTSPTDYQATWQPLKPALDAILGQQWHVWVFDWSRSPTYEAGDALNKALDLGESLGSAINWENYDHVHLVAHSAGSAMISILARHAQDADGPIIHTTFLDAYAGVGGLGHTGDVLALTDVYGLNAHWADQYFSLENLGFGACGGTGSPTQRVLPNAFNVDVSALDPQWNPPNCRSTHTWPRCFYRHSADGAIGPNPPCAVAPNGAYAPSNQ